MRKPFSGESITLFGSVVPYLFSKYMVLGGTRVCQTLFVACGGGQVEGLGHFWGTLGTECHGNGRHRIWNIVVVLGQEHRIGHEQPSIA